MPDYAIEARDLTKVFGSFTAVDGVSFKIERGNIFGFLGPNGAGKSTTIRLLCGLLEPTSGSAMVDGLDVSKNADLVKKRIGYMSQKFSLYEDLTVEENIRFFGGVYGLSNESVRERSKWVLDMAGLREKSNNMTGTLSGGWRQRLALGCAIIHEPPIVFLDEPTAGVDPVSRREFWELIGGLSDKGVTSLVTTHYLDEAEYCNNIVMLNDGKIMADGSPKSLKEKHITYRLFELETERLDDATAALRGEPWLREISLFGIHLHVGVEFEVDGETAVRNSLRQRNIEIKRLGPVAPTLNDVFLRVMGAKVE